MPPSGGVGGIGVIPASPPDEGGATDGVLTAGCSGGQCWAQTTWMTGGGQEEVTGAGAVG